MKRIFNWTFGSIFRTFGRIIAYLSVGLLLGLILSKNDVKITDLLGIYRISAKEISTTNKQIRWRAYNIENDTLNWSSNWVNAGTSINTSSGNSILDAFMVKYTYSDNYNNSTNYLAHIHIKTEEPLIADSTMRQLLCHGSISSSSYNPSQDYIKNCQLAKIELGSGYTDYQVYFTTTRNLQVVQFSLYLTYRTDFKNITFLTSSYIETVTSQSDIVNNQTNTIVNNQNQNTESIINNSNSNTNTIVNNQNQNTEIINNTLNNSLNNVCDNLFYTTWEQGSINTDGSINHTNDNFSAVTSGLIKLEGGNYYTFSDSNWHKIDRIAFYDTNQNFLSRSDSINANTFYVGNSASYIRINIWENGIVASNIKNSMLVLGRSSKAYCEYGTSTSKLDDTNNAINNLNDNINNDDSSGAQSEASDFFNNFTTNTHGLTGIITAPLNAIQSLTSKSCSPLVLPLPFVNQNLTLPCMREIYVQNFGAFMNIYDVITLGIISYWIMVRIFALVKDFKNPEHDEIEVMDL